MSFNIEFSYSTTGFVSVKIPTSQLYSTSVHQAPFSLQYRYDATAGSASFPENPVSSQWTVLESNGFTTYTRLDDFPPETTISLEPLTNVSNPNYISFYSTGFQSRSATSFTVAATDYVAPPPTEGEGTGTGPDNIAPTLDPNGIQKTLFMADGVTTLPNNGGKDSAYTVSFSERVTLPSTGGASLFGGVPPGTSFSLTPIITPTTPAAVAATMSSDLWHVKVTTVSPNAAVNLTLTPRLQADIYETTNANPPTGSLVVPSTSATTTYWAKVTLSGELYEGRAFDSGQLDVTFLGPNKTFVSSHETVALATSTSAKHVLYLGFSSPPPSQQLGYEVKLFDDSSSVGKASPLGEMITDSSGNQMEHVSEYTAMDPLKSILNNDSNLGTFISQGTSSGFDVLDMRALSKGPLIVEADYGFMTVYDAAGNPRRIEIDFYDKYILNDRVTGKVGNTFYGTDDSEYVVVGNGGDNFLRAGNQGSGSMAPETDIVDYSKVIGSGITVDLGNSVSTDVTVTYSDGRNSDLIRGFEGVVGSGVADTISGSNAGNYISGGDGNDTLRGYSSNNASNTPGDVMYNAAYLAAELQFYGSADLAKKAFVADSSDILVGGAGMDTLYGGAGSDFLVDLDSAVMWGSDVGKAGGGLRDNNTGPAEYDRFMVRGSTTETATIENFHLSKNGTGLAGRSYDAHDSIIFSTDIKTLILNAYETTKGGSQVLGEGLFGDFLTNNRELEAGMGKALYHYVYDKLEFTQTQVTGTNDMKLTATFSDKFGELPTYNMVMGEVIIADLVTALGTKKAERFQNQAEVVELAWLADTIVNAPERFNPKMDLDMINTDSDYVSSFKDMEIAFALELLQAGTIREANDYGVMASNLDDMSLDERIFNPDAADNTILGSAGKDIYKFIVQDFDVTENNKDFDAGDDTIFDVGGADDILAFSEAKIDELTFSAVKVGRESGRSSLKVEYEQTLNPGSSTNEISNRGEITWQGHFREGGRQAAEFVEVSNVSGGVDKYAMAKTEYQYDRKGYVIAGSEKLVANNMFNAIMVGRNDGDDEFVFKQEVVAGLTPLTQQKATIAGFSFGDKIDISKYGTVSDANILISPNADSPEESNASLTFNSGFVLNLSFQDAMVNLDDLKLALYGTS